MEDALITGLAGQDDSHLTELPLDKRDGSHEVIRVRF